MDRREFLRGLGVVVASAFLPKAPSLEEVDFSDEAEALGKMADAAYEAAEGLKKVGEAFGGFLVPLEFQAALLRAHEAGQLICHNSISLLCETECETA